MLRPAGRSEAGCVLVPGIKCAVEYLRAGAWPDLILVGEELEPELKGLLGEDVWQRADREDRLRRPRPHELSRLADQPHPEGLLLAGPMPRRSPPDRSPPRVVFDGVQDPGNLGTMLRTALWFGLDRVWLLAPCADPWSPRGIRAGMGAVFHLADCRVWEPADFAAWAREQGVRLLGLDAGGDRPLHEHLFQEGEVLVLGSESHGLRLPAELLAGRLRIPGAGQAESLNVGHALAICAWQQWLARHGAP
ncbi:MAG: RNA methyltransferase [bacterium]|nr:RNA methyltransferase [bacterium]